MKYLTNKTIKRCQRLIVRIRCENIKEYNKYWVKKKNRKYKLNKWNLNCLIEDCENIRKIEYRLK